MSEIYEPTTGECPACGHALDRVIFGATPELGEREYVCPNCGWQYETGSPGAMETNPFGPGI